MSKLKNYEVSVYYQGKDTYSVQASSPEAAEALARQAWREGRLDGGIPFDGGCRSCTPAMSTRRLTGARRMRYSC